MYTSRVRPPRTSSTRQALLALMLISPFLLSACELDPIGLPVEPADETIIEELLEDLPTVEEMFEGLPGEDEPKGSVPPAVAAAVVPGNQISVAFTGTFVRSGRPQAVFDATWSNPHRPTIWGTAAVPQLPRSAGIRTRKFCTPYVGRGSGRPGGPPLDLTRCMTVIMPQTSFAYNARIWVTQLVFKRHPTRGYVIGVTRVKIGFIDFTVPAAGPPANQPPTASFTSNCVDLDCMFDGSASSDPDGTIQSHLWDFGDGTVQGGATPAHTYAAAGTYNVTLTATDNDGATDTDAQQVTVMVANQPPVASFAPTCVDLDCTFDSSASNDPDGTIQSYAWDFGDGNTGTGSSPAHSFAAGGTYDVTLTVTDDASATGTDTQQVMVMPGNQTPTATFTQGCLDLDCTFDGSASSDPDGTIAGYAWDYGDGNTGTGATPTHTYVAGGTFQVTLTVTDDDGAMGSDMQQVTVVAPNQAPNASFTPSCVDLDCTFDGSGSSDPDGTIASYAWDFGNGNSGTGAAPAHTYAAGGTYSVELTVTDADGATGTDTQQVTVMAGNMTPTASFTPTCVDLDCTFDGSGSSDPDGTIQSHAWDFGDGNTGTGANPSHTYAAAGTFSVTLTVTDDDGATGTDTQQVTATLGNQAPTASFAPSCVDLDCTFDGSGSSDPDGTIASYAWDFGDGDAGTGANPTHTYAAGGTYDVTLTVTDDGGATGTDTQQVTVTATNQAPTASFTAGCTDLNCSFDGAGSTDPDGTIASYAWDFGDGNNGIGINPMHTYAAAATYSVTLTVTDDGGATGTDTQQVTATAPPMGQIGATIVGEAAGDAFGSALAISDNGLRVAVGAPNNSAVGTQAGHVRVLEWDGVSWSQLGADFDGPSQFWRIGEPHTIAMSGDGNRVAIGRHRDNSNKGAVLVYEFSGGSWNQIGQTISDANLSQLGYSVALSTTGQRVGIGAPMTGTFGNPTGAGVVFELSGGSWSTVGSAILGAAPGDQAGASVDISGDGNRIAIGAQGADGAANNAGHVRLFEWNGTSWTQVGQDMDGNPTGGLFGMSVSLSSDGARVAGWAGVAGDYAKVFELAGSTWVQMGPDFSVPTAFALHMPISLSSTGSRIAIGRPFGGINGHGLLQSYDWTGASWVQVGMDHTGPNQSDNLGWSVALSGDGSRVIAGMPGFDNGVPISNIGGARIFTVP